MADSQISSTNIPDSALQLGSSEYEDLPPLTAQHLPVSLPGSFPEFTELCLRALCHEWPHAALILLFILIDLARELQQE